MEKIYFVTNEELGIFELYCNGELIDDCSFSLDDPSIVDLVTDLNRFGKIPVYKEINL
jgi:hypothetical protein